VCCVEGYHSASAFGLGWSQSYLIWPPGARDPFFPRPSRAESPVFTLHDVDDVGDDPPSSRGNIRTRLQSESSVVFEEDLWTFSMEAEEEQH